mmetsp:Transcript_2454/g.4501  ORF Transcript_2454/g.4501 Transcript_2454/m.4501 type:complete len:555 (+) Transcript_2454:73-1737(+)
MATMYFILAMPAALHRQLYAVMPNENFEMNFNLLFTVSYFPNMILPFFGGAIVDRYGEANCLLFYCIVVLLGQILTSFGVFVASWKYMWAGRFVFGCGAQNLIVANASLISKWFSGSQGLALGLSNVCSYGGVIFANILSPMLANTFRPSFSFWLGATMELVAIVLAVFIVVLDKTKKATPDASSLVCSPMFSPVALRLVATGPNASSVSASPGVTFATKQNMTPALSSNRHKFKPTFWLLCLSFLLIYGVVWSFTNVSSAILLERDFFLKTPSDCVPLHPNKCTSGTLAPHDDNPSYNSAGEQCPIQDHVAPPIPKSLNISISDDTLFDYDEYRFKYLSKSDIQCHDNFWAEACTMNYCRDQSEATEKAGFYMSIPYFFTVALTFHLGLLVDKTGWRTEMITLGSLLLVLAHVLLAFPFTSPPLVPLVSQGLGYTVCVAALWPSVPYTVSPDSVGTAFGIMMSVQNVGLALIPLLVADLYGRKNNHYLPWVELLFAAISLLAVLVAIALMIADKRTNHILGTPKIDIRFNERNEPVIVNHIRPRALSDANLYH